MNAGSCESITWFCCCCFLTVRETARRKEKLIKHLTCPFMGIKVSYFPIVFKCSHLLFFRDLNEDPRTIRKRVEKDKATDKDWVTFKQNPARFTQVGYNRLRRYTCNSPYSIFELSLYIHVMHCQILKSSINRIEWQTVRRIFHFDNSWN